MVNMVAAEGLPSTYNGAYSKLIDVVTKVGYDTYGTRTQIVISAWIIGVKVGYKVFPE